MADVGGTAKGGCGTGKGPGVEGKQARRMPQGAADYGSVLS